ncbi:MAG TPA: hypothetical protein VK928_07145, partial [Longimicrobiales bacterium]|nr:hypothetical protein [Longimicrobiales bacterium]
MTAAPGTDTIDVTDLVKRYLTQRPDASRPVSFGTSGHRGTALDGSFTDAHIAAICAAIAEHRTEAGIDGPLFLGRDTHALSEAAYVTAIEVLAAHGVAIVLDDFSAWTPTPVISHAILSHNRHRSGIADGVVITPSHNPPEDGGFKYNPPSGGPADTAITGAIQRRANELLARGAEFIPRIPLRRAQTYRTDLGGQYITELRDVLDMDVIRDAGLKIGADPMGGAAFDYWDAIAEEYDIAIDVVNRTVDPTFGFMPRDWDGRIRMDCSSPHAMAGLIGMKDRYDVAFGNDPDVDRHGIVTPSVGLMNPNHYLAVAISYLMQNRPQWSQTAGIGKTLVSSSMIDRVAADLGR